MALEEKYDDEVTFIIVDVQDSPQGEQMVEEFMLRYIPAFFYIDRNGEIIGEDVGEKSFEYMEQRILEILAN